MTRTISLLGSTGSIGQQTLQVARELGLRVAALTAREKVDQLEAQVRQFMPRLAVLYDDSAADVLRRRIADLDVEVLSGPEGLLAAASMEEADTVVTAVVGSSMADGELSTSTTMFPSMMLAAALSGRSV